ncbi:peptide ABC transporter substrate-binding protein [Thiospirochaeta perfilievii]|uniref:Peptide ABC transporter substrate-binding protein n=1 Tax=Thiospirochaeta perfilievii TaxID=252967 RepID=A0A5C1Q9U8_9SPIO|nr:peptide ABC transporter substrate-binding protein [Thiospirochaeta perfilievii]QEN04825.1 peptide ABC transporter substrate-binding protein [Thiospirochaeta perfilievii]
MIKKITIFLILLQMVFIINAQNNEFNIAVSSLDLTLNPFYTYTANEAQFLSGIYEGLVSYNPQDLTPEPALAESWRVSEDKKKYFFKIRKDLKFSNGESITSETFRDSFLKAINPDTQAEFASLLDIIKNAKDYRTGKNRDVESVGISTDGEDTLIFTLEKRAPYFTKILCHHTFTPIPTSLLNQKVWSIDQVVSSGPYLIKKNESQITLLKNPKYWDKENVYFDKINIKSYTSSTDATADYNRGDIDWLTDNAIDLNSVSDLETLKVNPLFATTFYYFNSSYKEYKSAKIRKAISLLIPWNKIREKQYIPANSLIPSLSNFPKNIINSEQNIEEALKILADEGYKNGKGLSDIILSIPKNTYSDSYISSVIKENIEKYSSIKVIIKETSYPDFFTINRSEEFTISTLSWIGDFADPLTFLEMWTSNSNLNDSNFRSIEFDELIENSSNLTQDERYEQLSQGEKLLLENSIVLPINHSPGINVIDTRYINGWYTNTLDIHPFKYLRVVDKHIIYGLI